MDVFYYIQIMSPKCSAFFFLKKKVFRGFYPLHYNGLDTLLSPTNSSK